MGVITHISIKSTPLEFLKYITGESKAEKAAFVTGLNCSEEAKSAYMEMGLCYESYSGEKFTAEPLKKGKQKIKLHHYIQSFKADEITPEKAHKIAVQWAEKVFGKDRQILIATHADTEHIHTHFAVNAYDLNGEHWIDSKKTLKYCRDKSDEILKCYNLSIIENPKNKSSQTYTEWLARKKGTSWKVKLCDDIDRIVVMPEIKSMDDFAAELKKCGYLVKQGKYLSVKPAYLKNGKFLRTFRLGDGYSVDELLFRIENKDREMSLAVVSQYEGIQKEYAICLRELQIMVYRKTENSYNATYSELMKNAELLCFLSDNKIHSLTEFENMVNAAAKKVDDLKKRLEDEKDYIKFIEEDTAFHSIFSSKEHLEETAEENQIKINQHLENIAKIEKELEIAEAEKKKISDCYTTYIRQMQSDYTFILDRLKQEQEERERLIREQAEREAAAIIKSANEHNTRRNSYDAR